GHGVWRRSAPSAQTSPPARSAETASVPPSNPNPVSEPTEIRPAAGTKVVFVKGTALMSANADGSNVQTLVNDGLSKDSYPVWSPAGDKIVYWTSGSSAEDPKILLNLVVITANGQPVSTIPVLEAELGRWLLFHGVDI